MPSTWYVRKRESKAAEVKGSKVIKVVAKLIFEEWEEENGRRTGVLRKEVHHTLGGPNAEKILQAEAERLNAKGYVPPRPLKLRADGWRSE